VSSDWGIEAKVYHGGSKAQGVKGTRVQKDGRSKARAFKGTGVLLDN
jgi:hypothetical protein